MFYSSIETGEMRSAVPAGISKEAVLRKLHDTPFMTSCSPNVGLGGRAENPSAWITSEAEKVLAETPNATGPVSYWTMTEHGFKFLGDWAPGLIYTTASINHTEGYKSVVEAPMGIRLSMETRVVETEGIDFELVESMRGVAFMPMSGFVKKAFMDAHEVMRKNLIDELTIES